MELIQINKKIQKFKGKMISALIIIFIIGPSSLFSQVNLLNPRFEFTPGIRYDQLITSPKDYLG